MSKGGVANFKNEDEAKKKTKYMSKGGKYMSKGGAVK